VNWEGGGFGILRGAVRECLKGLRVTTRIMRTGVVPEDPGTSQLQVTLPHVELFGFCHCAAVDVVNVLSGLHL
jgi:hypothetical protein